MVDVVSLLDEGLGNASYLVDLGDGRALAVDPGRDPRPYLDSARRSGLRVAFTADTHLHNDFVSGSRELQALGATIIGSADAGLEFQHRGVHDGEELELGGLVLRTLATPGHTPEHVCYLLVDGGAPVAVFTGGSLLRGSVARTDLLGAERAVPLARALYESILTRLLTLPDELVVYPTHGAGATFCAVAPTSGEDRSAVAGTSTTIGAERRDNALLGAPDQETFARLLLDSFGSYPTYFATLREVNRRGPRICSWPPSPLRSLGAEDVRRYMEGGAELVDARPIHDFAAGHIAGSLSNALRPAFATWLGWLVDPGRALVFVLEEEQDRAELVRACRAIGYERLVGELAGGMGAWREAGLPEEAIRLVTPREADGGTLVDVRQRGEFRSEHIPDAHHVELGGLRRENSALPAGPLILHCGHGERAMTAASLVIREGRRSVSVLEGGPEDWRAAFGRDLARGGG